MGLAMNSYRGIVASASQLMSLQSLQLESYLIYFPKMISTPFLPEMIAPAEFITRRQSPTAGEKAGAGREGNEQERIRERLRGPFLQREAVSRAGGRRTHSDPPAESHLSPRGGEP